MSPTTTESPSPPSISPTATPIVLPSVTDELVNEALELLTAQGYTLDQIAGVCWFYKSNDFEHQKAWAAATDAVTSAAYDGTLGTNWITNLAEVNTIFVDFNFTVEDLLLPEGFAAQVFAMVEAQSGKELMEWGAAEHDKYVDVIVEAKRPFHIALCA